jgi:hypothetical protein
MMFPGPALACSRAEFPDLAENADLYLEGFGER